MTYFGQKLSGIRSLREKGFCGIKKGCGGVRDTKEFEEHCSNPQYSNAECAWFDFLKVACCVSSDCCTVHIVLLHHPVATHIQGGLEP
jgi:hypothetical protein